MLAERVRAINPDCRVTAVAEFFTASNAEALLGCGFTWVVDAIDGMSNKALLIAACVRRGQLIERLELCFGRLGRTAGGAEL